MIIMASISIEHDDYHLVYINVYLVYIIKVYIVYVNVYDTCDTSELYVYICLL